MSPAEIIALIGAAVELAKKIAPAVEALKQSGELDPEQEAELDNRISELKKLPHWQ